MYNYRITVCYDGTGFAGWQRQTASENTVQGKLEAVLSRLAGAPVEVNGAGRTDAGVHALAQTASFRLEREIPAKEIKEAFDRYLPESVCVLDVSPADGRFHARLSAKGKTYVYCIWCGAEKNVFLRRYAYPFPKPLDVQRMEEAARTLCGTHDFSGFCTKVPKKKSAVRTVEEIGITFSCGGRLMKISFTGNGFLYHQIRIMTGTLLMIGAGELPPETAAQVLASGDRRLAGFTAPPQGLFLQKVYYGGPRDREIQKTEENTLW